MKFMSFIIAFSSFVLTTGPLFLVGHMFTIPWLMFHHEYTDDANGFFITTGSLVPLIIGLIISLIAAKFYGYKYRQKLG